MQIGKKQKKLKIQTTKQRMWRLLKQKKIINNKLRRSTMKSLKMRKKKRRKKQNQRQLRESSHSSWRIMKSKHNQLKVFK